MTKFGKIPIGGTFIFDFDATAYCKIDDHSAVRLRDSGTLIKVFPMDTKLREIVIDHVLINGESNTIEEAHRKLWEYLSEHPETPQKESWFYEMSVTLDDGTPIVPPHMCFACLQAHIDTHNDTLHCKNCPIRDWSNSQRKGEWCGDFESLYLKYRDCISNQQKRSKLAHNIANLPWNPIAR